MTIIANIISMPAPAITPHDPLQVNITITNGVYSYFKLIGSGLEDIVLIDWYPVNPSSVLFELRPLVLVDENTGTFFIRIIDNFLDSTNREGQISFRLTDGSTLSVPVATYGPVSTGALWTSPYVGINTG